MQVEQLARQIARDVITGEQGFDQQKYLTRLDQIQQMPNKKERDLHNGAAFLVSKAMINVAKREKRLTFIEVSEEIGRISALVMDGWEKQGASEYAKKFDSPRDMIDTMQILEKCNLDLRPTQPISDFSTELAIPATKFAEIQRVFVGRQTELG